MITLAVIATATSVLALGVVSIGILAHSARGALKSLAIKTVGGVSSQSLPETKAVHASLPNREAKMPSLATLYAI